MHPKQLGICGELSIASSFAQKEYPVFKELGDLSKTDLIVLVKNKAIKVQVKARNVTESLGTIVIDSRKSGPNYKFRYSENDVDIFAVLVPKENIIFYVPANIIVSAKSGTPFRLTKAKRGHKKGVRYVEDYLSFEKALINQGLFEEKDFT